MSRKAKKPISILLIVAMLASMISGTAFARVNRAGGIGNYFEQSEVVVSLGHGDQVPIWLTASASDAVASASDASPSDASASDGDEETDATPSNAMVRVASGSDASVAAVDPELQVLDKEGTDRYAALVTPQKKGTAEIEIVVIDESTGIETILGKCKIVVVEPADPGPDPDPDPTEGDFFIEGPFHVLVGATVPLPLKDGVTLATDSDARAANDTIVTLIKDENNWKLKGNKVGTTTITLENGGLTDSCEVTVTRKETFFDSSSYEMTEGEAAEIPFNTETIDYLADNGSAIIDVESDNRSVLAAELSYSGDSVNLNAVGYSEQPVRVTVTIDGKSDVLMVSVNENTEIRQVELLAANQIGVEPVIETGETLSVDLTFFAWKQIQSGKEIVVKSSDESVVKAVWVDTDLDYYLSVTGLKPGKAVVEIWVGYYFDKVLIEVKEQPAVSKPLPDDSSVAGAVGGILDKLNGLTPDNMDSPEAVQLVKDAVKEIQKVNFTNMNNMTAEMFMRLVNLEELMMYANSNVMSSDFNITSAKMENISIESEGAVLSLDPDSTVNTWAIINVGDAEIPAALKDKINSENAVPLDITLSIYRDGLGASMNRQPKAPIRLTMDVPEGLTGNLVIYQIHNGEISKIKPVMNEGKTMSFYITKFSTFVIDMDKTTSGSTGGSGGQGASKTTVTGTWVQDANGWWYRNSNGSYPSNGWFQLPNGAGSEWFHFNEAGYMETGLFTDTDGNTYYLNPVSDGTKGAMLTGWQQIGGTWYCFKNISDGTKGAMYKNTTTPDGFKVNETGAWVK